MQNIIKEADRVMIIAEVLKVVITAVTIRARLDLREEVNSDKEISIKNPFCYTMEKC